MKIQELKVLDVRISGYKKHRKRDVIIHDLWGGQPSIALHCLAPYRVDLVADLEKIIQNNVPEYNRDRILRFVVAFNDGRDTTEYEEEFGVRIEHYNDYLERTNPTITPHPPVPGWQIHTFQEPHDMKS